MMRSAPPPRHHRGRLPCAWPQVWLAAESGRAAQLAVLCSQPGVATDSPNRLGNTPLHVACQNAHASAVAALLRAGSDPTVRNKKGRTVLDQAVTADGAASFHPAGPDAAAAATVAALISGGVPANPVPWPDTDAGPPTALRECLAAAIAAFTAALQLP